MNKNMLLSTGPAGLLRGALRALAFSLILVAEGLVHHPAAAQAQLTYPSARQSDAVDTYHGVQVADPYRWMEALEGEELKEWVQAQDELRAGYLDGMGDLIERLQERIYAVGTYASQTTPILRGNTTFFFKTEPGQTFGTLYMEEKGKNNPRPLLNFADLNQGSTSAFMTSNSPEGRYLTYNVAENQSRWNEMRIFRVADGELLDETLTGIYSGRSTIAWTLDEAGFFYGRYDVPDDPQAPLGRVQIYYHRIGTPQDADRLVYEHPTMPEMSLGLRVSHDGRYLLLAGAEDGGSFSGLYPRLFYKDLEGDGEVQELFAGTEATYAFEGSQGGRFWIRTTHEAPLGRLVEVDLERSEPAHWKTIIPEAQAAMQAVSEIGDRLVVQYVKDARTIAQVFDVQGRLLHEIDHLTPTLSGFADDRDHHLTYYMASSLIEPRTIYRLDVRTGETTLHFRPKLNHDSSDFALKQVFYESKDGTQVPMFLVHRNDLKLDGTNPVFMYAYGAWAWSAFPWQGYMLPWVEMGGVYAVPNIRGGGEYGEAWHQGGMRHNKQNGIDDYIAAAEWLIENRYTSPARMIANGGSASGILPAVAVNQRPDLFGASVINFPALDMLRYEQFGSAKSWVPEFGTVEDADDFATLHAYSPYHNLKDGACYPPTLIQVGEHDNTTTPMHGYKYAAALQARQDCAHPVILKVVWGAGHSYGLTPEQSRQTQAEELAFLVRVLEMDGPALKSASGSH